MVPPEDDPKGDLWVRFLATRVVNFISPYWKSYDLPLAMMNKRWSVTFTGVVNQIYLKMWNEIKSKIYFCMIIQRKFVPYLLEMGAGRGRILPWNHRKSMNQTQADRLVDRKGSIWHSVDTTTWEWLDSTTTCNRHLLSVRWCNSQLVIWCLKHCG